MLCSINISINSIIRVVQSFSLTAQSNSTLNSRPYFFVEGNMKAATSAAQRRSNGLRAVPWCVRGTAAVMFCSTATLQYCNAMQQHARRDADERAGPVVYK